MRKLIIPVALVAGMALLVGAALSVASENATPKSASTKAPMQHYLIMATHTPEECMKTLDEFSAEAKSLNTFEFGCKSGDHTAYAIVAAANEEAARNTCPASMRASAKVVALNKFTPAEIKKLHEGMASH